MPAFDCLPRQQKAAFRRDAAFVLHQASAFSHLPGIYIEPSTIALK